MRFCTFLPEILFFQSVAILNILHAYKIHLLQFVHFFAAHHRNQLKVLYCQRLCYKRNFASKLWIIDIKKKIIKDQIKYSFTFNRNDNEKPTEKLK